MRGLYAHTSDRMRAELKAALQERWEESLRARTAIRLHSPVPLLDRLLATHRHDEASAAAQNGTTQHHANVIHIGRRGEAEPPTGIPVAGFRRLGPGTDRKSVV